MKRILLLAVVACGLLGGCATTDPAVKDPHRFEDITGPDDTEKWW